MTKEELLAAIEKEIEYYREFENYIDLQDYHKYSLGFPDAPIKDQNRFYELTRRLAEIYSCQIWTAECAVNQVWSMHRPEILDLLT